MVWCGNASFNAFPNNISSFGDEFGLQLSGIRWIKPDVPPLQPRSPVNCQCILNGSPRAEPGVHLMVNMVSGSVEGEVVYAVESLE